MHGGSAALLGLIWAGYDGFSDRYLVGNYLGKPVLAVLGYGLMPATVLGRRAVACCGAGASPQARESGDSSHP